ncbi:MAG: 50S ribosomal protein L4 [Atopobiaceae bacterium]|jgi:large subunit ribosomal protein L4|nr:50S ribosomal protein L4 [Atopobiaceae bacterium]MCH4180371.1 50S ribosomal protein L4 [Atopobiaceae bacterium]MCH4214537.1 50S ribosomal protein L4 [Atopobiaceae bacterium]MCH4229256.1 50S ribosomal protein L4 [Atopobiaceae bacterium]MCH4276311.1 50S ribosomal protein L4 [Atopobiaceae bacterium]
MSQIEIKNAEGKKVKTAELSSSVFGIEPNIPVTHQVVTCQLASLRQGTHSTKGRSEVSGGGAKPWRQKGTGRARQGSIRAGQWVGGGVVFGPTPHSHARRTNNKEVKLAMRSVLSGKLADSELFVVDAYGFDKPSTKQAASLLEALGLTGKRVTVVVSDDDINTYLSFRNVARINVIGVGEATAYNLIDNGALLMCADVATKLEEVLA